MKTTTTKKLLSLCLSTFFLFIFTATKAQLSTYTFTSSSEPYVPLTGGVILGTAVVSGSGAAALDDIIYNLGSGILPFTFQFNYTNVSQIYVSTNGFITFGAVAPSATSTSIGHSPISATTAYDGCASAFGRNLMGSIVAGSLGELKYETIGVAPNRKFVVQYKNFKPTSTANIWNFQIRLCETSNNIEIVYGSFVGTASSTGQVGLRGASNALFLNRKVTGNWSASVPGTLSNDVCAYATATSPSGLMYKFGPPPCSSPISLGVINVTMTTAELKWSVIGVPHTFNVEYGPSGFTPGTGTITNNVSSPLPISGLVANTNYQFYVTQNCSSSGNGISTVAGPKNFTSGGIGEECATASTISVSPNLASCAYSVITSGVSQNGPLATCADATGNLPDDDRWIKFIAPSNGSKLVIFTTAGTNNDWVMQLWTACPSAGGTVVICGDDENATMPQITLCQNQYVAGQEYYLRMWTYSNNVTGNMNLCIYQDVECPIAPVNDDCAFASRVNINPPGACPAMSSTFTTKYALPSSEPTACGNGVTARDVWMVFNTGSVGDFNLDFALGSATSLKAAIVFECNGNEVICFNPAAGSRVISGLNPASDYILRVWSDSTNWGTFSVCMSDICLEPAASISGATIICEGDTAHLQINLSGGSPWTLTYSDGIINRTVVTSNTPYMLDTAPSATTFYTLVSVSNPTCSGMVSGNYLVNVIPKPVINNFTPTSGSVGTNIIINGNNFSNVNLLGLNGVTTGGFTVVNNSQISVNVPSGATSGLISVRNLGCTTYSALPFTVVGSIVQINMKLFIEGFYQNGIMAAVLDPINKPMVCDSIILELHDNVTPFGTIHSKGAELSINGDVTFNFPLSVSNRSYYLAIKHRNSIETWSSDPIFIPAGGIMYNITNSPLSVFGGNLVNVGTGSPRPASNLNSNLRVSKPRSIQPKIMKDLNELIINSKP